MITETDILVYTSTIVTCPLSSEGFNTQQQASITNDVRVTVGSQLISTSLIGQETTNILTEYKTDESGLTTRTNTVTEKVITYPEFEATIYLTDDNGKTTGSSTVYITAPARTNTGVPPIISGASNKMQEGPATYVASVPIGASKINVTPILATSKSVSLSNNDSNQPTNTGSSNYSHTGSSNGMEPSVSVAENNSIATSSAESGSQSVPKIPFTDIEQTSSSVENNAKATSSIDSGSYSTPTAFISTGSAPSLVSKIHISFVLPILVIIALI